MTQRRKLTEVDVATTILPQMFGTTIKYITYEQLTIITKLLNLGWNICPGFYGEKTDNGTVLKPNLGWFIMWLKDENKIFQYTLYVNYNKNELMLYDSENLIATFYNLQDTLDYIMNTTRLSSDNITLCTSYYNPVNLSLISDFIEEGFSEYIKKNDLVYQNMSNTDLEFSN